MNILTFDIEDWFHVLEHPYNNKLSSWKEISSNLEKNVHCILEMLEEYDQHATFFCLGWIADHYPHLIKAIALAGHEIGSHTYSHQLLKKSLKAGFKQDVERSVKSLEDITGQKTKSFRSPAFQIDKNYVQAYEKLGELGISYDSSIQIPARNVRNPQKTYPVIIKVNGYALHEFPIPTHFFLDKAIYRAGSGYFRLFPYAYTRKFLIKNRYNLVYFHPRDFETELQFKFKFNYLRSFKHKVGRKQMLSNFAKLLSEFRFTGIEKAAKEVNWEKCRVFEHKT